MSILPPSPALQLATLGGVGFLPGAPGTWAALLATLAAPWVFLPLPIPLRLLLLAALYAAGAWSAGRAAQALGRPDPPQVVIDELLGQWVALLLAPSPARWWELLLAFGLFRLFDISKPWPVGLVDRTVPGGHGIMLDDLVAGILALGAMAALLALLP